MFQNINEYDFRHAFERMNRADNFSHEGLDLLYLWLEEYEDATGQPVELDVIAICCDWTESSHREIRQDFDIPADADVLEYLADHTSVAGETQTGTIVYAAF